MRCTGPRAVNEAITRRVTDGDSSDSPAAASRTARSMSAGSESLIRKPAAPACSASNTCSSVSNVVSTITRTPASAGSAATARSAAIPSSRGIRMSIRTTSGRTRRTRSSAARPSSASPTSSRSSSELIKVRSPIRTSGWSSTTTTGSGRRVAPAGSVTGDRRRGPTSGSSARSTRPPTRARPSVTVPPSEAARSRMPRIPLPSSSRAAPGPSSLTSTTSASGPAGDPDGRPGVAGVPDDVRQALLHDPERRLVHRGGQRLAARRARGRRRSAGRPRAAPPTRSSSRSRPGGRRPRLARRVPEHPQRRPQLGQRVPARAPDRLERRAHLRRDRLPGRPLLVEHVQRDAGLHGHHRQAVADDVVHLAGDPQPLLVRRPAAVLLAVAVHGLAAAPAQQRDQRGQHGEGARAITSSA